MDRGQACRAGDRKRGPLLRRGGGAVGQVGVLLECRLGGVHTEQLADLPPVESFGQGVADDPMVQGARVDAGRAGGGLLPVRCAAAMAALPTSAAMALACWSRNVPA